MLHEAENQRLCSRLITLSLRLFVIGLRQQRGDPLPWDINDLATEVDRLVSQWNQLDPESAEVMCARNAREIVDEIRGMPTGA